MVIRKEQPIPMPRPFGGEPPVITVGPRTDGKEGRYITVQISGVIQSIYQYLEFIQALDTASKNDIIDVMIDTPGGCVFTTQVLLERMNSSEATVTAVASGLVASAGTFLWFFSKHREVKPWATFMFHSSSHGDYGKSLSICETSKEMVTYMQKTVKAMIAAGILTSEEATKIFAQKKDLFLPGKLIRARMLEAMASTEGLKLRAEGDPEPGEDAQNDRPADPDGKPMTPDETNDDVDGEKTSIDPAAIFRAEGVEPGEGEGEGAGEGGDDEGEEEGAGEGEGTPDAKCGKGKKKAKKAKKRARAEGDEGGEGEGEGEGEGDGSTPDQPVDPEKAATPNAYLKW